VNTTETWIVFNLNPDGSEYDQSSGTYRNWRKNRQPTPGTTAIGTDLNRNYGYAWACCGGSSGTPSSETYRGPRAWSAPETRAMRDFVNSRVVGGRQQIVAHLTFHTSGRLVLWPWGHTAAHVPIDDDAVVLAKLGGSMASLAGYTAKQSYALYVTDGDEIDWMYGTHRILSFTVEMADRRYPPDEMIPTETARVMPAVDHLLDHAGCPYEVIGRAAQHCPPSWVTRLAGNDRYATAVALSRSHGAGVPVVYVASGTTFPDALSGGVAAGLDGAPLLLVRPSSIPAVTATELTRLRPGRIVVLGGSGAVSDAVRSALGSYTAGGVTRLSGIDRYATAAAVSAAAFPAGATTVYVASGSGFADALAGVPAAVTSESPLLLTRGDRLPDATRAELVRLAPSRILVLGGPGAVSDAVVAALRTTGTSVSVTRLAGTDRYATATTIARATFGAAASLYVASGVDFPDALAGGPAAGATGVPLLLSKPTGLPASTAAELGRLQPPTIKILGGTAAVSQEVAAGAAIAAR
jgi:putative cell wall-binding protein